MAAALFESLLMNHPFVDGNKRVAFFATDVFLRVNGFHIDVKPDRAHAHLIGLMERREANKANLERWLRKHAIVPTKAVGTTRNPVLPFVRVAYAATGSGLIVGQKVADLPI